MEKRAKIYEGKAKILYETSEPDLIILFFKDEATAFNARKKGIIHHKGIFNNLISTRLLELLGEKGIPNHFVKKLSEREMLVRKVEIIPIEVVVRNRIAGSIARRFGMEEGGSLPFPVVEFYYKNDELGDPLMVEDHIRAFNFAAPEEVSHIRKQALACNEVLRDFFGERGIDLVDFKLEFGRYQGEQTGVPYLRQGDILLADEITPDGCRLWDKDTEKKLDKDRFRRDLGSVEEAYREVYHRVVEG